MTEKVNPCHPDKVADRIAGALVDLAYSKQADPKIAVEVLIGHGTCTIICESSVDISYEESMGIVQRLTGDNNIHLDYNLTPQDEILAGNQKDGPKCGDNGIFKGCPITHEQFEITRVARNLFDKYKSDGKYILDTDERRLIICQSNAKKADILNIYPKAEVNPLGDWTGGTSVDAGATNRKLGSDMFDGVTGGGLHGKDLSKADVTVNIWCFLRAQERGEIITALCAIGDEKVHTSIGDFDYKYMVEKARLFIADKGGFEAFAEWGLF